MKLSILSTLLFLSFNISAAYDCSVAPSFVESSNTYDDLDKSAVEVLFTGWSAPVNTEVIEAYEGYSMNTDAPCMNLMNTYLKDKNTGKQYLMVTTHEDYCDGGNVYGYIFDVEASKNFKAAIVAEVNDGDLTCVDSEKYNKLKEYLSQYGWMN